MFEKEKLFGNNFNDWFARLKLVLRVEKKMHVIEQPLPPAPKPVAEPDIVAQWTALYDAHTEIACLMLGSMTPELHRQFELYYPFDMIQKLRSMFKKQAGVKKFDLIQSFHACKQEEGKPVTDYVLKMKGYVEKLERLGYVLPQDITIGLILNGLTKNFVGFVRNYNMHNMGKTIGEIQAMLIEYEKGLHKKAETPQVMTIRGGKIQKANKKSLNAKGNNKVKGKGKDKKVYIPKPKNPKPTAMECPAKDDSCHHCKEVGHWKRNCPVYLAELLKKKKQVGSASSSAATRWLLKSTDDESFDKCESCLSGKMKKKTFPRSNERAKDLLGIIHTDVCGPLRHVSRQGVSYFITFTDDYSRYSYVYLLKHIHEVFETFNVFKKEVENQLRKTIKAIRSDRGGEYISQEFKDYLKANGIVQQLTPPYTPQHNGVSERRNRTLLDMVRSMINLTTLPLSFWDYALESARGVRGAVRFAKGYTQLYGVDYEETFLPVADIRAIRILISIAAYYDYEIWQMDVKTAFLNGYLDEDIYMVQPEGFVDPNHPRKVCKLQRSIYGLKQASRSWNKRFDEEIKRFGFTQNLDEPCVYQKASGSNVTFLILYVDDIIIMGNHIPSLQSVKDYLGKCFAMKDLGEAAFILGIKIYRDKSKRLIGLCQNAYMDKILKRYKMDNSKRGHIPMQERLDLNKSQGAQTPKENPGEPHWTAVKNILKYLRNTKDMFLVYGGNPSTELRVECYCDAGFETDRDETKSQARYVFVLNGGAVDWNSSKQSTTAMSVIESEYIAASEAAMKAVWIRKFISGLGIVPTINEPLNMYCDNSAAVHYANEPGIQRGAKHYHRRYHYVCKCVKLSEIKILKVHTDNNLADPFTKALSNRKLTQHARSMGLRPASSFM
ncbi:retrotransposon protein, putative, ty1-copia subclass [Tanacetum coccineum]